MSAWCALRPIATARSAPSLSLPTTPNLVISVTDGSIVAARPAYNTSVGPAAVTSVAFSSLGMMASGCEDKMIRVYDSSWNLAWSSTNAHSTNVTAVAFSPDGLLLATASLDRTIRVWSTTTVAASVSARRRNGHQTQG